MGLVVDFSSRVNLGSFMCLIDLREEGGMGGKQLYVGRKLFELSAGNASSFTIIRIKQAYQHGTDSLKIRKPNILIFGLSNWY